MSSGEPSFRPPWWARDYDKHHPLYAEERTGVVNGTGAEEGVARYHPDLSVAEIERIEMGVVAGPDEADRGEEIVGKRRPTKRIYWKKMRRIMGASQGKETQYIYVEYGNLGNVHGRPITPSELRAKGAKL